MDLVQQTNKWQSLIPVNNYQFVKQNSFRKWKTKVKFYKTLNSLKGYNLFI